MNNQFGSKWRKWDLHIHTPASFYWEGGKKLRDMSESEKTAELEKFVEVINKSDVSVFCIMDYWTFDWYIELREYLNDNPSKLNKTIFPGMELRVECPVDYRLNIHCLLSDKLSKQELIDFKSELYIRSIDKKLSDDALIRFANTLDASKAKKHGFDPPETLDDDKLLQLGSITAEITKDSLKDAFKQIPVNSGFIVLPYDTSDGLLKLNWEVHPHDDNYFMQTAHIIETRDIANINLFNGKQTQENEKFFDNFFKTLGNKPKPCISGSDAHRYEDYGVYPSNRVTWIKADPTFEGFKQIIYEPLERIIIQESNPETDKKKLVIDYVEIRESNGYIISDEKIILNRDLVSIIGGRGSGKSALLETIAFCFDKHLKTEKPQALIPFYKNIGANADIFLQYKDLDGNAIELYKTSLLNSTESPCSYPFFYISQNQIEKFASDRQYLHSLAFETIRINSAFSEKMTSIQEDIDKLLKSLEENFLKINNQRELIKNIDQDSIEIETNKLKEELKLLESESTREVLSKFNQVQDKRATIIQAQKIEEDIKSKLEESKEFIENKIPELYSILDILGIDYQRLEKFFPELENYFKVIDEKLESINNEAEYQKILLEVRDMLKDKLDVSVEHIEALRKRISSNESIIKSNKKQKDLFENLIKVRNQTLIKLESFFQEYSSVYKKAVDEFSISNTDVLGFLELEPELIFETDTLLEIFLQNYVDKRKIKTIENLRNYLKLPATNSYSEYIKWIVSFYTPDFNIEEYDAFYPALEKEIEKSFIFTHPRLSTKIGYNFGEFSKSIDQISLGQKGTILLKLFLSTGNNCPIIIDQPEDHLDNTFIYKDLVQTIRNAKKRRQIIVVTHNANLVVNGDAEQVIVAQYENEKIIHTVSGSLENPLVREQVTSILEGGKDAFIKREQKYQFADTN